jgi:SAM-dependent methyltransferase
MSDAAKFGAEYYHANYRHYERHNPARKMEFYRGLVTRYLPPVSRPRVLDLGCAFAKFLGALDASWSRFGIDLSEYAIQQAHKSLPGVGLTVASCTAVPFKGPFQAMVAFDVIEHVADLDQVAAFVRSELAPDGAFVFVVPVYDGPLGGVVRLLDGDPTHVHKESRDFWLKWASERFEIQEWSGVFRYLLPLGPYINWPTRSLRRIAPAIAVVVRNKA